MKKTIFLMALLQVLYVALFSQTQPFGSDTSGDPYLISTLDHLRWTSENSCSWDKYFEQTADMDVSATSGWNSGTGFIPIGNVSINFTGSYNGKGFSIDGLTINRPEPGNIGWFGKADPLQGIAHIEMTNVIVSVRYYVGGIVVDLSEGLVPECKSTGSLAALSFNGGLRGVDPISKNLIPVANKC